MKNYKKIDHFESIVMKCTQEQFEEIRETLEKYGCVIDSVYLFKYHDYLTNRWCGKNKNIANHCNAHSSYFSKKLYEDWNAKTFLKACGIVEREPTTKVRNSVLLKLADNNSYSEEILKKECPKLFPTIDYGVYLKCRNNPLWLCYYDKGIKYGFDAKGVWFKDNSGYQLQLTDYVATPQEVETALKSEFEKQNNVKLNERKPLEWSFENVTYSLSFRNLSNVRYCKKTNSLYFGGGLLFRDGKFAKIIETPTDIITIVEKYGKDKVISLIEKM